MTDTVIAMLGMIGITPSDVVSTERLSGLTNANYLVKTRDDELIVRIGSADRACAHDMSRDAEAQVLASAQAAGLGVEVLAYELPDGHLVTRRVSADTYEKAPEQFADPETFACIVERVKQVHALPPVAHVFDPIGKAKKTIDLAMREGIDLPRGVPHLLEKAREIEARWRPTDPAFAVLCHNDLFSVNILQTIPATLIDWEFVGMGDPFFDLATLLVACDDAHPLGLEHRELALTAYCGEATHDRLMHLNDMLFVVRLHAALWGVVQQVLRVPEPDGFSYARYAEYMLNQLMAEI